MFPIGMITNKKISAKGNRKDNFRLCQFPYNFTAMKSKQSTDIGDEIKAGLLIIRERGRPESSIKDY